MKIILINNNSDKVRTIGLNRWTKCLLSVLLLGVPLATGAIMGVKIADGRWQLLFDNSIVEMQHQIVLQQQDVAVGREQLDNSLSAMTVKLAKLRSRLVRLDALGEQLTQIASLEDGEFDFSSTPGLGGPLQGPLVEIAEQNKDSEDLETTLVLMKNIQNKWKTIGHIPRRDSDKLWKRFRGACNTFFDRYHEQKNNV